MKIVIGVFFTLGAAALLLALDVNKQISVLWQPGGRGLPAGLTFAGRAYCLGAAAAMVAEILAVVGATRAKEKLIKSEAFHLCSILIGAYVGVLLVPRL